MIKIGEQFPSFSLKAIISNDVNNAFTKINKKAIRTNGPSSSSGLRTLPLCVRQKLLNLGD